VSEPTLSEAAHVKQCCASVYGSDAAKFLLGESFHPGGAELTSELASYLHLTGGSVVLDVASGKGTSALLLAETFACRVVGIDLSEENVSHARAEASNSKLKPLVSFQVADAERLPFDEASFDAILCECAFCTFPNKRTAAQEFARVVKPAGRVGISDLTRSSAPLPELNGLLAWIACIGDAQPLDSYSNWLTSAGFSVTLAEQRDAWLQQMVQQIRGKLLLAEVLKGLKKLDLPGLDLQQAKDFARAADTAVQAGQLGYGIIVGQKLRC
jgi:ubiquinone/menaquinone biosynthesis C-methylase UbiE